MIDNLEKTIEIINSPTLNYYNHLDKSKNDSFTESEITKQPELSRLNRTKSLSEILDIIELDGDIYVDNSEYIDIKKKDKLSPNKLSENKLSMSWADIVDEELSSSMEKKPLNTINSSNSLSSLVQANTPLNTNLETRNLISKQNQHQQKKKYGNGNNMSSKRFSNRKNQAENTSFIENIGNDNLITNSNNISVDDIININFGHIKIINLAEYQIQVCDFLKKQCRSFEFDTNDRNEVINFDTYLHKLNWLVQSSKFISNKMGLTINDNKNINIKADCKNIPRSSYKFCKYGYECQYNYSDSNKKCTEQHFVYNLVFVDILSLFSYISNFKKYSVTDELKPNIKEISKCLNTLSFVLTHMYDELRIAEHYGLNVYSYTQSQSHSQLQPQKNRFSNSVKQMKKIHIKNSIDV